jgi:hypothetical protein
MWTQHQGCRLFALTPYGSRFIDTGVMPLGAENVARLVAAIRAVEPLQSVLAELESRGCHHRWEGGCYVHNDALRGRATQCTCCGGGCSVLV